MAAETQPLEPASLPPEPEPVCLPWSLERRLRDAVWSMRHSGDWAQVLTTLTSGLRDLGLRVDECGINLIGAEDGAGQRVRVHGYTLAGQWDYAEADDGASPVPQWWRGSSPVYRRDLHATDLFGERRVLAQHYGHAVRSVVDVPFTGGTLAVNSSLPDAFSATDLRHLQRLTLVLDEALGRRAERWRLEQRQAELEAQLAQRQQVESALQHEHQLREAEIAVRLAVASMSAPEDLTQVIAEISRQARHLGIAHERASIQILNADASDFVGVGTAPGPNPPWERLTRTEWGDPLGNGDLYPWVAEVWRRGEPLYQPAGRAGSGMEDRAILDVPFSHGTLAISNARPAGVDADRAIPILQRLARALNEGFQRFRDLVSQQQALAALRATEARWQFALEGAGNGVWDWDVPTGRVYYSPQWKAMLGWAEEEIGDTLDEWDRRLHPDDRNGAYEALRAHFTGAAPVFEHEHRLQTRDGSYRWILDRGRVVEWVAPGQPRRVVGTHTDITGRRQAEEAARQRSEAALRRALACEQVMARMRDEMATLRTLPDLYAYLQEPWCAAIRGLGVPASGVSVRRRSVREGYFYSSPWGQPTDSEQPCASLPWVGEAWQQGRAIVVSRSRLDEAGVLSTTVQSLVEVPFPDGSGSLAVETTDEQGFDADAVHLLERFAALLALAMARLREVETERAHHQYDRVILETAMDGYWLAGRDGRLRVVNAAYCVLSGYTEEELLSLSVDDLEAREDPEAVARHMQQVLAQGSDRFESEHRRKDGSVFPVEVQVTRPPGQTDCTVAFIRDLSARRQAEEAARVALAVQHVRAAVLTMAGPDDLNQVTAALGTQLAALVPAEAYGMTLVDLAQDTFTAWRVGPGHAVDLGQHKGVPDALRQAIVDGLPVYRRNRAEIGSFADHVGPQIQSVVDLPFAGGTLAVYSREAAAFTDRDLDVLSAFTPVLAEAARRLGDLSQRRAAEAALRRSEERFRGIFLQSPIAIELYDEDGRLLEVNPAALELFGVVDPRELMRFDLFADPNVTDEHKEALRQGRTVAYRAAFDFEVVRRLGLFRTTRVGAAWLDVLISSMSGEGRTLGYLVQAQDVTRQRQAEADLQEKSAELDRFFSSAVDLLCIARTDGRLVRINAEWYRQLGYAPGSLEGARFLDLVHPEDLKATQAAVAALAHGEEVTGFVNRYRCADNSWRWLEWRAVPAGPLIYAAARDITERWEVEHERELTLQVLRLTGTGAPLRDLLAGVTRLMQEWTGCAAVGVRLRQGDDYPYCETRGFPAEFVECERHLCARDPQGELERDANGNPVLECMCGNVLRGRTDARFPFFTADGSFWSNNTTQLLASTTEAERQAHTRNRCNGEGYESVALVPMRRGGEAIGLLQFNDRRPGRFTPALLALLERLAANVALGIAAAQDAQALRESEAQLATLFRRSPALMTLSRLSDGRYLQVNDRFCDVSGFTREEAVGRTPVELGWVSAADRRQILALLATGDTMHGVELTLRAKDGGARHCLYFGEILHAAGEDLLLSLASDLTEQKRVMAELEEQRLRAAQADRLHALGEMATGIAHELNQPLNGIRAFAEGALLGPQMGWALSPEETAQTFADIVTQVDRISGIIDHVRAFARDETQQDPVGFRITEPVEGALKVMGVQLRVRGIRVRREDAGVPAMCLGWPHAIEQVLLNLISNAGDALESRRQQQGGEPGAAPGWSAELVIRTAGSVDGETARLEVEDNGGGVATQVVDRIFEPYFTTKEMGKGTGIGLAIVRGIVARHHGRIEVDNRPGDGVTFRIDLPTVASVASTPDEPDGHGLDRDAVGVTP